MHISSIPKFLGSFFKSHWSFDDYPIYAREQDHQGRENIPRWVAGIDGLYLTGLGNTRSEAIEDLRSSFSLYSKDRTLPRPGRQAPLEFSSTENVERLGVALYDFVEAATGVRPFFLSDASSFSDFSSVTPFNCVVSFTTENYGADISDAEATPIWMVFDKLHSPAGG